MGRNIANPYEVIKLSAQSYGTGFDDLKRLCIYKKTLSV